MITWTGKEARMDYAKVRYLLCLWVNTWRKWPYHGEVKQQAQKCVEQYKRIIGFVPISNEFSFEYTVGIKFNQIGSFIRSHNEVQLDFPPPTT